MLQEPGTRAEIRKVVCETYPGHPLLVALQIMTYYSSLKVASNDAIKDSRIDGSGDAIVMAVELLDQIHVLGVSIDNSPDFANGLWFRLIGHQEPFQDKVLKGMKEAEKWTTRFKEKAEAWFLC